MKLRAITQLLSSSSTDKIFAALESHGGSSRFVGGCVRDAILNKKPKDIDIATNLLPQQVQDALNARNIKNFFLFAGLSPERPFEPEYLGFELLGLGSLGVKFGSRSSPVF